MKVEIIKIEKEAMDWPKSRGPVMLKVNFRAPLSAYNCLEGDVFELQKIVLPNGDKKNYFVKMDELGLFTELMEISTETLRKKIHEAEDRAHQDGYRSGRKAAIADVKSHTWWERLLMKF